jgi:hypothetical protein
LLRQLRSFCNSPNQNCNIVVWIFKQLYLDNHSEADTFFSQIPILPPTKILNLPLESPCIK